MSDLDATLVVAADQEPTPKPTKSLTRDAWRHLSRSALFWASGTVIVLLATMAVVPALFVAPSPASHDPRACSLRDESGAYQDRLPPSSEHWFGTDLQGCDYYARVIYGARASMTVGLLAVVVGGTIAIVLGGLAGYAGGWIDTTVSRLIDVFFGFPLLIAAILLLTAISGPQRSTLDVALVLGLLGWPLAARLFRSSVQQVRGSSYADAARTMGSSAPRVLVRHVLPNALTPLLVYGALAVGVALVAEAGLSFLGIGLQAPTISWGQMIESAQQRLQDSPHLLFFPGLFLTVAVLAFLALADVLRRAIEPRGR
jgi:oligopeptide transport system permease protein